MIEAVTSPGLFLNILRVRNLASARGRLEVPVAPVHSIYARFEHLRAVATPEGGVPLLRLRVLDKLIDRLLSEGQRVPEAAQLSRLDPEQAETLIRELGGRLQRRLLEPFRSRMRGFAPETGMLVDLVA